MGSVRAFRRGEVDDAVAGVRELVDQGAKGFVVLAVFDNGDSIADWTFGKVSSATAAFMSIILTDLALESRRRRNARATAHRRRRLPGIAAAVELARRQRLESLL